MKKLLLLFVVLFAFVVSAQQAGAEAMEQASVQTATPLVAQTQKSDVQTLSTLQDADTLGTLHDGETLEKTESAKKEEAKKESAGFSPASSSTFGATVVLGADPLSSHPGEIVEEIEGTIQENQGEVTQEKEDAEASLEVGEGEETLESTEDYQETLSAAINTARHLEVDQPEVLSGDSLETPTQDDEKMLNNEEEATVEEDSEAIVEDKPSN